MTQTLNAVSYLYKKSNINLGALYLHRVICKKFAHYIVEFCLPAVLLLSASCTQIIKFQPNVPEGGRAQSLSVNLNDNNTLIVASETGGLFRTNNGGKTWSHLNSLRSYLGRDVAYAPHDHQTVIATTGGRFRINETGIWRSIDGGTTWTIPNGSRLPASSRCADIISAHGISFAPDTSRLFVGTDCGLAISDDLGQSWTHIVLDPTQPANADKTQNRVLSVLAQAGGKVIVAGEDGIWRSQDSGATWQKSTTGPARLRGVIHGLAVSPYAGEHIFLAHRNGQQSTLYLSNDGGENWISIKTYDRDWARPLFVQTVKTPLGTTSGQQLYQVYFGEGVRVRSVTFIHHATNPTSQNNWIIVPENHADPSQFAIHSNGAPPLILATDGGLHKQGPSLFLLKENGGDVHIHTLNPNGVVGAEIERHSWSNGWTTASFFEIGGSYYLFLLKESDGTVHIHRINVDGSVGPQVDNENWSSGWTQAVPYSVGNASFLFLLKMSSGNVHIHQLLSNGKVGSQVEQHSWSNGWSTVSFFEADGNTYLFLLKESDGTVHIHRMNENGSVGPQVDSKNWSSGWTQAVPYSVGDASFLFLLKGNNGTVHIHQLLSNGKVGSEVEQHNWSSGWSTASFFKVDGSTYLFLLKESDGTVHIHRMNENGAVGPQVDNRDWSSGWTQAVPYSVGQWQLTGAGPKGYNALQLTEITGQEVSGTNSHLDLYYGTQDNKIYGSADGGTSFPYSRCCEGFFLRVPPKSVNHSTSKVTGVKCGGCMNFITDEHLQNIGSWPNPPDGDANPDDVDGNPFALPTPGHYIQRTLNNDEDPIVHTFKLTTDYGATWASAYTIDPPPAARPIISGSPMDPIIYQAVVRPGGTPDGLPKLGLKRISGLYSVTGATLDDADVTGLGSLGIFPTMFAWYSVFGVDPWDTDHLIAPDIETDQMKYSYDGGKTWYVNTALTNLVTRNGTYLFRINRFPMVTTIGFDPYSRCHILVGTAQNGILRSTNGGKSWKRVKGSKQVTNVSSFYFPSEGQIFVSTYGRGIWKMKAQRSKQNNERGCTTALEPTRPRHWLPLIWDIQKHVKLTYDWPPKVPEWCPKCSYIVVKHGQINDIQLSNGLVSNVNMNSGFVTQYDANGNEVALEIPNTYNTGVQSSYFTTLLEKLSGVYEGTPTVRGLVIEDSRLRGLLISENNLPIDTDPIPSIQAFTQFSVGSMPVVEPGGKVTIHGTGFATTERSLSTTISLNNRVLNERVKMKNSGSFRETITIDSIAGPHEIAIEQRVGNRLTRVTTTVLVVPGDDFKQEEDNKK